MKHKRRYLIGVLSVRHQLRTYQKANRLKVSKKWYTTNGDVAELVYNDRLNCWLQKWYPLRYSFLKWCLSK